MPSGTPTNRTNITLPAEMSEKILATMQTESAVMQLAQQIRLPGAGVEIPVITSDPTAAWVAETGVKPVSNPGLSSKLMTAYKLAVIVPFSNEFRRDASALYDELVRRLPRALAQKFDETVFGTTVTRPGSNFDVFGSCTAQNIGSTNTYAGIVAADLDIATHGGIMNGLAISPQGKSTLLAATDQDGRPLFINNISEGAVPMVLGAKTVLSKGAYVSGSPNTVGVAGDWSQAFYGTVEGIKIDYSSDASLVSGSTTINLFQENMFAVRAEIEIGFRANTDCFNKLTVAASGGSSSN